MAVSDESGLGFPVGLAQYAANLTMLPPFLGQPFMDGAYWSIVAEIIFCGWVGVLMMARVWRKRQVWIAAAWLVIAGLAALALLVSLFVEAPAAPATHALGTGLRSFAGARFRAA
ncbi:hypothetical protein [Stappia sp. ES.058]|uniref:hypothetical protein n=1 Tax=Stappia sp. ES.058 TaxID=1881061 RepID=UPI0012FE7129|nr:hypothetical protein [Stappia sp. ES.058]